ncbi:hypothetical protein ROA7450_01896 [Roseovarius albus]|uniref:Uncharacterized protein n=2 Tax=Roseovarius albus TaxID=1247867 RepID=A0A1X6Z3X9_9RHOB|nr:hypothetical protein ROA7450_01896 [Roseovarius albus]
MTMKPKAAKYRTRRNAPKAISPNDGAKNSTGDSDGASEINTVAKELESIRQEGLTGRQLRMARKLAQRHSLEATSDFDAVRLLRARGLDPFQRPNVAGVQSSAGNENAQPKSVQLPQTVSARGGVPSEGASPAEQREREITEIRQDIARRRRKRLFLLLARLSVFVFLPTLIAGYYYFAVATPMYSSKSTFQILTADGAGTTPAGLFQGTAFATGPDSIATQEYLQSMGAMIRLDEDMQFRETFSTENVDPLQRLKPDATNNKAYKLYKKYIKLGYDPTEGLIRMEVSSPDPLDSVAFSEKLIEYAEENVDQLSKKKRRDTLEVSSISLEDAKQERRLAQQRLVTLQEGSILDPQGEIAGIRTLIGNVEIQLQEKQLALNTQLGNSKPNRSKVEALQGEVAVLEVELARQKARLTQEVEGDSSLASKAAEIQIAQADLATADLVLQSALETKRQSEIEANKQVRYLSVSVRPVASEEASYPKAFENTLLAFLIFAGIYLMLSLTVSILKEQMSS